MVSLQLVFNFSRFATTIAKIGMSTQVPPGSGGPAADLLGETIVQALGKHPLKVVASPDGRPLYEAQLWSLYRAGDSSGPSCSMRVGVALGGKAWSQAGANLRIVCAVGR